MNPRQDHSPPSGFRGSHSRANPAGMAVSQVAIRSLSPAGFPAIGDGLSGRRRSLGPECTGPRPLVSQVSGRTLGRFPGRRWRSLRSPPGFLSRKLGLMRSAQRSSLPYRVIAQGACLGSFAQGTRCSQGTRCDRGFAVSIVVTTHRKSTLRATGRFGGICTTRTIVTTRCGDSGCNDRDAFAGNGDRVDCMH